MDQNIAATFLDDMAALFQKYAADLRLRREQELTVEPAVDPLAELSLGPRQHEMVDVLRAADERGLTTSRVCELMGGYDTANGHVALRTLQSRGVLEEVPGERPIRWRLAPRYRATADPYLAIAEQVRPGEWTTYGDVSVAVRGDTNGARAVGRAAAMLEHFPNPHRVLQSGGRIPDGWRPTHAPEPDPAECRRRLEAEGVEFDEHGRASRRDYVAWDVLVERAEGQEAA
jgi:alkylated DNA nucleotide flippase Atl1